MDIFLVNFATTKEDEGFRDFSVAQERQNRSAQRFGLRNITSWQRQELLETDFYVKNKNILKQIRGAGFWLWKPFIILEQLKRIDMGDILIYLDSGIEFIANPQPLIDICVKNDGFFFVEKKLPNDLMKIWTKRDCFYYMNLDYPKYHNAFMTSGGIQIYRKSDSSLRFVDEWLNYCTDVRIITDGPNTCGKPNLPGFVDHRHDMSILSLLRARYNIQGFRFPTQYGNHLKMEEYREPGEWLADYYSSVPCTKSPYGTIFFIGRGKTQEEWYAITPSASTPKFYKMLTKARKITQKITARILR